ncbi:MAG: molybdopterin molybdotransferase MoeA, partial [Planktomarina sp.]|nr:molybdopterin molybdotransferase MoeA [Planktomarina sp.]
MESYSAMISVNQALDHILALSKPLNSEPIPLQHAVGRILAHPIRAHRDQPPFSVSAMDGYAISGFDLSEGLKSWKVIGESAAGHHFCKPVCTGQATRIFTGAIMPEGTDHVLIQEHVTEERGCITISDGPNYKAHLRPAGGDFTVGYLLSAPRRLTPQDIALIASMNTAMPLVTCKPKIAIIATGDELVQPGETPRDDQIIASNTYGLAAMLQQVGAETSLLPIARDRLGSLGEVFKLAHGADLIITIGGASEGDHDLVAQAADNFGMQQSFYKVSMRPGKPLMAGKVGNIAMVGLPGNPVSAMVCGEVFVVPLIKKMLGLPSKPRTRLSGPLAIGLPANGPREHYMRGKIIASKIHVDTRQDSALLTVLNA